jgi:type I restriction enzyme S subunit
VSWSLIQLKELGDIQTGSTPSTTDEGFFGGDIPFVTPGDLDQMASIQSAARSLTQAGADQSRLLPENAVLVCCIGSLGKVGIAGRPLVTNQQINAIVFYPDRIFPRYGFFACRRLKRVLETLAPATTVPIVNKTRFSELRIPVPPLPEQRRIAAILDQADTLRTQRRAALAQLDSLTQSLFLEVFGDPVTNPKGWPFVSLTDICHCYSGGTPSKANNAFWDGMVPWFSAKDMKAEDLFDSEDHIAEAVPQTTTLKLLPKDTVAIVVRGMILAHTFPVCVLRIPATINQDLKALIQRQPINAQ